MAELSITMVGARGLIKDVDSILGNVYVFSKKAKVDIQLIDADMVCGRIHLLSAIEHAKRSFERKENTSTKLSTEILLYASGERQIKNALKKIGVKNGTKNVAVIVMGKCDTNEFLKNTNLVIDDSVLDEKTEILQKFCISKKEADSVIMSRVYDLILERVAMVDVMK